MNDTVGVQAARYISDFGDNAENRVRDDISRAIGAQDWDVVHKLERVKLRIRRAQLCTHIRMALELGTMPKSAR